MVSDQASQIAVFLSQHSAHMAGRRLLDAAKGKHFNVFPKYERGQLVGFTCYVKYEGDEFYRPIKE